MFSSVELARSQPAKPASKHCVCRITLSVLCLSSSLNSTLGYACQRQEISCCDSSEYQCYTVTATSQCAPMTAPSSLSGVNGSYRFQHLISYNKKLAAQQRLQSTTVKL
eukprot:1485806-Pleurochrysis_carterae.AAC.1